MSIQKITPKFPKDVIQRSLELVTPEFLYSEFKGTKFLGRKVVPIESIVKDVNLQPRSLQELIEHVASIRIYKDRHGELLHLPPKVVFKDPVNIGKYILLSGYNRLEAELDLGWTEAIVDVLEFDSPMRARQAANWCNQFAPARPLTKNDVKKSLIASLNSKEIETDMTSIMEYARETWSEFSDDVLRTQAIRALDEAGVGPKTLKEWDGRSASRFMTDELGCAASGGYDSTLNTLVYVNKDGGSKTTYFNTIAKVMHEDPNTRVTIFGYIERPEIGSLKDKRQEWVNSFNELDDIFYGHLSHMLGVTMTEAKAMSKVTAPWEFGGFLPQNWTPDPKKGGKRTEEGIVDVNGQPFGSFGIERGVFINQRKAA